MALKSICFLLVMSLFVSCKKEIELDPCLNDPVTNNATLKRMIDLENRHNADSCSLLLYSKIPNKKASKEYYFVLTNGSPVIKYHFINNAQIINCDGVDVAEYFEIADYEAFFADAKYEKKIWSKNALIDQLQPGTCNTTSPLKDIEYFKKLDSQLNTYAWRSIIYQYSYKNKTVYYGLYTGIDQKNKKSFRAAAMDCTGANLQENSDWSQSDFLTNAILERKIR